MITFTRVTQTYDEATDTMTSAITTVTGDAIQVQPSRIDLVRMAELALRVSETIMLLFTPTTYGHLPMPGDTVLWPHAGVSTTYTVRDVSPLQPDGVTILARVACSR